MGMTFVMTLTRPITNAASNLSPWWGCDKEIAFDMCGPDLRLGAVLVYRILTIRLPMESTRILGQYIGPVNDNKGISLNPGGLFLL